MKIRDYEVTYRRVYQVNLPIAKEEAERIAREQAKAIAKRVVTYLNDEYDLDIEFGVGLEIYHAALDELVEWTEAIASDSARAASHEEALSFARHPYRDFEDEDTDEDEVEDEDTDEVEDDEDEEPLRVPRPIYRMRFSDKAKDAI